MVNLAKYNPHWKEDLYYGYEKKRDLFHKLARYIDARQVLGVIGLRRTGKSVLLLQLIDHLIGKDVKRHSIVYFSFDEEQPSIEEILEDYRSRIGKDLHDAGRTYLFLDEIQKLENWQNQVKYYYDSYPNLKFLVSGSCSIFLKKKAEESLAGRIFLFNLPVMTFKEYLAFKGKEEMLQRSDMFKEILKGEVVSYMKRQLPELVNASDDFIKMYVESIISKVIYEDMPKVFPVEYADVLERILKIIANNPGIITDYDVLSKELGISRKTLSNYISYLERAFLVQKCYNFSRNLLTSEKKLKRLYLTNTTILFPVAEPLDFGRAVENLVVNSGGVRFFWRSARHEVDAILEEGEKIVPVESKFKGFISKKDLKGIFKFMKKFGSDRGYVITEDVEKEEDGGRIIYLPLWKWLLKVG